MTKLIETLQNLTQFLTSLETTSNTFQRPEAIKAGTIHWQSKTT